MAAAGWAPDLYLATSASRFLTLCFSSLISFVLGSSLTVMLFTMLLAREAYSSVDRFSSKKASLGVRHATIVVKAFPPREFFSKLVRAESRKGTWAWRLRLARLVITFLSAKRD